MKLQFNILYIIALIKFCVSTLELEVMNVYGCVELNGMKACVVALSASLRSRFNF